MGAKLLMTFDSEDYITISTESQAALTSVATTFAELEETFSEEVSISVGEPVTFSMEMEEEASFEETFSFEEEVFEEAIIEEEAMEEEIYEETEEVESSFEPTSEEEVVSQEEEAVAEEEEVASEEQVEEESTEVVEETNEEAEEETQEEESTSETATASTVSSEKAAEQKKIQQEKAIVANIERVMDKVDEDVKDIAKNLALKNIIKIKAMASEQASLDLYRNAVFYRPENIYLKQLNIFDFRQIYPNTSLASYMNNDKIEIKARKLQDINIKKQRLLIELEMLKNG